MTRITASDMAEVARSTRALSEAIARPCPCGRHHCTRGLHAFHATRDAEPGPPASTLEPTRTSTTTGLTIPDHRTRTSDHQTLKDLARRIHTDSERLQVLLDNWRPDRGPDLVDDTAHTDEACTHHMTTIGQWVPRSANGLCDWCRKFRGVQGVLPPREILQARHEGRRITEAMIAEFKARQTQAKKRQRRKRRK